MRAVDHRDAAVEARAANGAAPRAVPLRRGAGCVTHISAPRAIFRSSAATPAAPSSEGFATHANVTGGTRSAKSKSPRARISDASDRSVAEEKH